MTLKSAFHPIIGDKIFGWMGDTLDVLSVATTLFGVCTSLGLGAKQLNAGFSRLNPAIEVNTVNQSVIIWIVTALATVSVVSGIRVGIRRISEVNFLIGQFLMLVVFFQEDSWYLLNNFTQSIAFYFQVPPASRLPPRTTLDPPPLACTCPYPSCPYPPSAWQRLQCPARVLFFISPPQPSQHKPPSFAQTNRACATAHAASPRPLARAAAQRHPPPPPLRPLKHGRVCCSTLPSLAPTATPSRWLQQVCPPPPRLTLPPVPK